MAKRWSDKAKNALLQGIGSYGIKWFQRNSGTPEDYQGAPKHRTRQAIYNKALREWGHGGLTRGALTLRELMTTTGYSRSQLLRAREALKQRWGRLGPKGDHLITEEQAEEILEWLKHDYWSKSKHLYCCLRCQTNRRDHFGLGLCTRCYPRYRRHCQSLGVPTKPIDQRDVLEGLGLDKSGKHGSFLESITQRLVRGLALSEEQLEWLHLMTK